MMGRRTHASIHSTQNTADLESDKCASARAGRRNTRLTPHWTSTGIPGLWSTRSWLSLFSLQAQRMSVALQLAAAEEIRQCKLGLAGRRGVGGRRRRLDCVTTCLPVFVACLAFVPRLREICAASRVPCPRVHFNL